MSLLQELGSQPLTIDHKVLLPEAARQLREGHVGSLVVTAQGQPVGLVTDRDLALRALGDDAPYDELEVRSCASKPLHSIDAELGPAQACAEMRRLKVRRLGLLDPAGELVGVVSLDDLLSYLAGLSRALADTTTKGFHEEREPTQVQPRTFGPE